MYSTDRWQGRPAQSQMLLVASVPASQLKDPAPGPLRQSDGYLTTTTPPNSGARTPVPSPFGLLTVSYTDTVSHRHTQKSASTNEPLILRHLLIKT